MCIVYCVASNNAFVQISALYLGIRGSSYSVQTKYEIQSLSWLGILLNYNTQLPEKPENEKIQKLKLRKNFNR